MDITQVLSSIAVRPLVEVAKILSGGTLGFDPWKDPRTKRKAELIEYIKTLGTVEAITKAIAKVVVVEANSQPVEQPASDKALVRSLIEKRLADEAAQAESIREVAKSLIEKRLADEAAQAEPIREVGEAAVIVEAAEALNAQQTKPENEPQPSLDAASKVSEILAMPFSVMREQLLGLVIHANRPPVIVEKIVEVEKVVEKVINVKALPTVGSEGENRLRPQSLGLKSCNELFGIRLDDAQGNDTMVEVFDSPTVAVDPHYVFNEANLRMFLVAMKTGRWSWLYGPPGTGKTEFVNQLAARLGRPVFRIQFDGSLERYELIGGERLRNGSTVWTEGQLTQALETPHAIVLLDEVSFGRPEHLSMLHAVLEPNGYLSIPETGRVIQRAQGTYICAADNTNSTGDMTGAYAGTRPQNRAFANRFGVYLKFDYLSPVQEAKLITDLTGVSVSAARMLTDFAARCRTAVAAGEMSEAPSLRVLVPWAEALVYGVPVRQAFDAIVAGRLDPASAEAMQQLFNAQIPESALSAALVTKI